MPEREPSDLTSPERRVLQEDEHRPVFLEEGRVHRRALPWSSTIHDLLRHLAEVGFTAPNPLGIIDGWETLEFIPGVSGSAAWQEVASEVGLVRFAMLLRSYHDAVLSYEVPANAAWAFRTVRRPGDVICHNDFAPWNSVWTEGRPVAMLDFDFAAPGPAIDDVAYAARYVVPFDDDVHAMKYLCYEEPPNRRERLRLFAEAYGGVSPEDLFDSVVERQRKTADQVRELAAQGIEPQQGWVKHGRADEEARRSDWTLRHRHLFL